MFADLFCPESLLHLPLVLLHPHRVVGSETEHQCKRPPPRIVVFPRLGDLEHKCKQTGSHQHSVSENTNKIILVTVKLEMARSMD